MKLKEEKVSAAYPYQGRILKVEEAKVRCPNGNIDSREVIRHNPAAAILALTSEGKIILERQYRYAYDEILYEIPAGKQDEHEDPIQIALRELEEETGFYAHHMECLGKMYPSCGYTDEIIYLYFATDLEKKEKHWDENEFLELEYVTLEEMKQMILDGTIVDAKTICALELYLLRGNKQ